MVRQRLLRETTNTRIVANQIIVNYMYLLKDLITFLRITEEKPSQLTFTHQDCCPVPYCRQLHTQCD